MILATDTGWLIAVHVIRETATAHLVEYVDDPSKQRRIAKNDPRKKLFDTTDAALTWIDTLTGEDDDDAPAST